MLHRTGLPARGYHRLATNLALIQRTIRRAAVARPTPVAVCPGSVEHRPFVLAALLDRFLYRTPFEGGSARRYAASERPAFGDLDDRILDGLQLEQRKVTRLLDLGCGPATFAMRAASRFPDLTVIAVEPSRDFIRELARPDTARPKLSVIRAVAEALPLASGSIDAAICLSSIRHVRDRGAAFRELRRVVRPGGIVTIIELDPRAERHRIAAHANHIQRCVLRYAFAPLVLRTAPTAGAIAAIARGVGFTQLSLRADAIQPVYIMELV